MDNIFRSADSVFLKNKSYTHGSFKNVKMDFISKQPVLDLRSGLTASKIVTSNIVKSERISFLHFFSFFFTRKKYTFCKNISKLSFMK